MEPENGGRDLPHIEAPSTSKTGTDADVARLIQNVGATSIAEFERLIGELQEVKKSSAIRGGTNTARDDSLHEPHADGGDAPDSVEVGEAGIAVDDATRRQRRVQLVG